LQTGTNKKNSEVPDRVYAQVPVKAKDNLLFEVNAPLVTSDIIDEFTPKAENIYSVAHTLRTSGFEVLQVGPLSISIAGSPKLYKDVFKTDIVTKEVPAIKPGRRETTTTMLDSPETDMPGLISASKSPLQDLVEGVALEQQALLLSGPQNPHVSHIPPTKPYWHLKVPGDISTGMTATTAHRAGFTGRGINQSYNPWA
jgi:hypothetical protein